MTVKEFVNAVKSVLKKCNVDVTKVTYSGRDVTNETINDIVGERTVEDAFNNLTSVNYCRDFKNTISISFKDIMIVFHCSKLAPTDIIIVLLDIGFYKTFMRLDLSATKYFCEDNLAECINRMMLMNGGILFDSTALHNTLYTDWDKIAEEYSIYRWNNRYLNSHVYVHHIIRTGNDGFADEYDAGWDKFVEEKIDMWIDYSINYKLNESTAILLNYRHEHFCDKKDEAFEL